jgi:putative membrane protein
MRRCDMNYLINFLKGAVVGIANIIPGVSGGTMAVITGIYQRLIDIIGNILSHLKSWEKLKEDFKFLIPIGLGAVIGIVAFSKLLKMLLELYNMPTLYCFLGLIIGSLPLIFKSANKNGFQKKYLISFIITILFMIILNLLATNLSEENTLKEFEKSPLTMIKLIGYGFVAAGTMVIPGISGSMVMMIMGIYTAILTAVSNLDIIILIPFAIGVLIGVIVVSKIINILLEHFYGYTYYAILGFIIGSIIFIFPGFSFNITGLADIITFVIGFLISFFISKFSKQ